MTPSDTDIEQPTTEAPAAPQVDAPEESAEQAAPEAPATEAPAEAPAAPQVAEQAAPEPAAEAPAADAGQPATPLDAGTAPESQAAPAAAPKPPATRRNRQADRRKQLEELSRQTAAHLGREPDRKIVEQAILSAGGPDAVREFLATPQESREGKPLGWRIACLREARRHEANGRTEEGWVTLSAVPVRQIRSALDRAVVEEGRVTFRDEAPQRGNRSRGPRGDRRPGGRDERAVADQFMSGGVASFGGDESAKKNPFAALNGLLDGDDDK